MPIWSDLYRLKKPSHGEPVPPLEKGLRVSVHWDLKYPKDDLDGGITFWVKVIDVIGDDVVAKTIKKIDHIRRNELMIFDKSYIYDVRGDWEYSMRYLSVKMSRGVYYQKLPISTITYSGIFSPLSYGAIMFNENEEVSVLASYDWITLTIPEAISFAPQIEEVLKKGCTHKLFGDVYLPTDTLYREDDEDEWQYYD